MITTTSHRLYPLAVLLTFVVGVFLYGCSEPADIGKKLPNKAPVAQLANIPRQDSTINPGDARPTRTPLVSLYWVGNDGDGFVTAFMYRWSYKDSNESSIVRYRPWTVLLNYVTYNNLVLIIDVSAQDAPRLAPELFRFFANTDLDPERRNPESPVYDSALVNTFTRLENGEIALVQGVRVYASNPETEPYPVHESPNKGEFIFESDDDLNRHTFEILAIDNEGAMSERADTKTFWTPNVEPPKINITDDPGTDSLYVLSAQTYTWSGIIFTFQGQDRNSRTLDYSWQVDDNEWSPWSRSQLAAVTAVHMDEPYTGDHLFRVRCRNEFGAITLPDSQPTFRFFTVYPAFSRPGFQKRVLLVNVTKSDPRDTPPYPGPQRVEQYYRSIFDQIGVQYDYWSTRDSSHPSLSRMSRYSTVYIIPDVLPPDNQLRMIIPGRRYAAYMDVGGNVMFNGLVWPLLAQFITNQDSMIVRRMHLQTLTPYRINNQYDFQGAYGYLGYPSYVRLDPQKLDPVWEGAMRFVGGVPPRGFGEIIFRFDSKVDNFQWEYQAMGIRYLGATFKSVFYGIPLYFVNQEDATAVIRKTLQDFGEI